MDDDAALILAVLWENWNNNTTIEAEAGLEFVNKYLVSHNRDKLSAARYNDLLEDLESIKSIVLNDGKIKLNEKIHIKY